MKSRTTGFLGQDKIDQSGEIFDYIKELHNYLWDFVRAAYPGASGNLDLFVDSALEKLKSLPAPKDEGYLSEDEIEKILPKKTYFTSNAQYYTREDYVKGWNEAIDDCKKALSGRIPKGEEYCECEKPLMYYGLSGICRRCQKLVLSKLEEPPKELPELPEIEIELLYEGQGMGLCDKVTKIKIKGNILEYLKAKGV